MATAIMIEDGVSERHWEDYVFYLQSVRVLSNVEMLSHLSGVILVYKLNVSEWKMSFLIAQFTFPLAIYRCRCN